MRKALIAIASVAAITAFLLIGQHNTKAADHLEPAAASGMATDILDVFAFMQNGGNKLNLIATFPTSSFSNSVQYVFHVNSSAGYGMPQTETLVLCQFESATDISCWVGAAGDSDGGGSDYQLLITGDPSDADNPLQDQASEPQIRVFAGERNDPFFFNLSGFQKVASFVRENAGGLTFDANSCPNDLGDANAQAIVGQLAQNDDGNDDGGAIGGPPATDDLEGAAVAALVIQLDDTFVNSGGSILGVWASTRTR